MPTVLRAHGFRVAIYLDDHPPPHVHALKGSADVRILLDDCKVDRVYGATRSEVEKLRRTVYRHREQLLTEWRRIHARPDR